MDMATISALIGSIKTATDLAKLINESGITLEKAEVKLKLAELISALADAKMDIATVQQALLDKDAELARLLEQISIKEKLNWEAPYYWLINDGKKDGPYCQQCYDNSHKLIRLNGDGRGFWECKTCKNTYLDKNYSYAPHSSEYNDYDPFDRHR